MSLLKEIRSQSAGVRKAMFGLSVIALVSLAGTFWFRSFQTNLYALMNADEVGEETRLAERNQGDQGSQSPFAMIGGVFKDLGASMSGFLKNSSPSQATPSASPITSGKARSLPISR